MNALLYPLNASHCKHSLAVAVGNFSMTFAVCPSAPAPFLTASTSILSVVPGWREVRVWEESLSAGWMEPSWVEWDTVME